MRRSARRLLSDIDGAVAPTIALSLTALIAVSGIAFDYTRLASMDTELQSAADQAALAAAAQLDNKPGACSRAATAARSMLVNRTYMANDASASGTQVTIPLETACDAIDKVRFWQDVAKTTPATNDANAKFVEVTVDSRTARYALTPIVAAFSGTLSATAFAGLDSAICRVPPLMMCNPNETNDAAFTIANYVGKGIRLVGNDGGGFYGPGNFGFLDVGAGNGAATLRQELAGNNVPGNCVSGSTVDTETGNIITLRDALNTRFGIYDGGNLNQPCGNDGSGCPPSANIRKDLLLDGAGAALNKLGLTTSNNGWKEATNPYPGVANITPAGTAKSLSDAEIASIAPMGYPEDKCHAFKDDGTGVCSGGRIGDGNWDRFAYFRSNSINYPSVASLTTADTTAFNNLLNGWFGTTTPTRYQVYHWEMTNLSPDRLQSQSNSGIASVSKPSLLAGEPVGVFPDANQIDRRVLSVAIINCTASAVGGHTTGITPIKFVDIFLVQPSLARSNGVRTDNSDIYVEVIGLTQNATDAGAVQLVKKSVPYLIE